jgi:methylated-DNA-[protein]-cysteine S-methyltransferase
MTVTRVMLERMPTPIGVLLIVSDHDGRLRAVGWDRDEIENAARGRQADGTPIELVEHRDSPTAGCRALEAYFAGELAAIDRVAVETGGTAFQREVWSALRRIPVGSTVSYGALAAQIGRPTAVRAVGLANGSNPVAIVVPCHRVIGADASLTGYGGGLERKRWLLAHEGVERAAWRNGPMRPVRPPPSGSGMLF